VLDLFAGCGGFSLGFQAAGFKIAGAVECDRDSAAAYARNLFRDQDIERRAVHGVARDITAVPPAVLTEILDIELPIDVIIGGPPCQAFARVGRAKLRALSSEAALHLVDPRADLYQQYLAYVAHFRPRVVLMENVPEFLNFGGSNLADVMGGVLEDLGYDCVYTLLNAVNYGVPQLRERAFLIAMLRDAGVAPRFPQPTHWFPIPVGYRTTRTHALRSVHPDLFESRRSSFHPAPRVHRSLRPAVTAHEAIGDLPPIHGHRDRSVADERVPETSEFAAAMQKWTGFEAQGVENHVTRRLPRDYPIFERMQPGDQYPEAWRIARSLFNEELQRLESSGVLLVEGSPEYKNLERSIVPPYDPRKFANKWRKMEPDTPARTLMAHLGRDCYTHIHYDSSQARTISVREAARLQSFPDGFIFPKSMNAAFRMIGNAVPPVMALAIAREIRSILA
jgi:DNA (cytosine-5)-methyltransferase 1